MSDTGGRGSGYIAWVPQSRPYYELTFYQLLLAFDPAPEIRGGGDGGRCACACPLVETIVRGTVGAAPVTVAVRRHGGWGQSSGLLTRECVRALRAAMARSRADRGVLLTYLGLDVSAREALPREPVAMLIALGTLYEPDPENPGVLVPASRRPYEATLIHNADILGPEHFVAFMRGPGTAVPGPAAYHDAET